jgi:ATPase subunit of ABC transporter with duplicated ATPase domains
MDLPSIECIEDALQECNCALLLVSHDKIFLDNIVTAYWNFEARADDFVIHQI